PLKPEPGWVHYYLKLASRCLQHKSITLAAAAVFFAGGIMLAMVLPGAFMPADDNQQTQVALTMQPGTKLQDTVALAEQARQLLQQHEHVQQIYTAIGSGNAGDADDAGGTAASVRSAVLTLSLNHRQLRPGIHKQ